MISRRLFNRILPAAPAVLNVSAPAQDQEVEIPLPPVETRLGSLPGVDELPVIQAMPPVMVMNSGAPVRTKAQWSKRKQEIRTILEYYAVGRMPPAPGNVRGRVVSGQTLAGIPASYRLVELSFGPGGKLRLNAGVFTPAGKGPFAVIVLMGGTPPGAASLPRLPQGPNQGKGQNVLAVVGPAPIEPKPVPAQAQPPTAEQAAGRFKDILGRGYAIAMFNPNDCAEDTTLRNLDGSWAFRNTRFYPAYPGYDWGILGGWAWGASRVADYLETDRSIDKKKMIITGASRNGKAAMIAAAFDDRFMGAPVVTGGGGMGAYRFTGPRGSETLDVMLKKYPNWFSPHLRQFRGKREKLAFDQHWFLALCAPRPFIALEGITDRISLPEAVRQSIQSAMPAYELFGATERLGVNYAGHGHAFTEEDWTAMMDFADWHWRGRKPGRSFNHYPGDEEVDAAAAKEKTRR